MEKYRQDLFRFDAAQVLACCTDLLVPFALQSPIYSTITDGRGNTVFKENERYTGIIPPPKDSEAAAIHFEFDPFMETDWVSFNGDIINADTGEFVFNGRKLAWLWNMKEYSSGCSREAMCFIGSLVAMTLNEIQVWAEHFSFDGALNATPDFFEQVVNVDKLVRASDFGDRVTEQEAQISAVSRFISRLQTRLRRIIPQLGPLTTMSESVTQGWHIFIHESYNGSCTIANLGDARILDFELKKGR